MVIDTFARAAVDLDENSAKDVSLFVNIVDTYLRHRWGNHALSWCTAPDTRASEGFSDDWCGSRPGREILTTSPASWGPGP